MNREPLFIIGNPRSGTSLLRSLLNAHQDMCIPPECGFLLWLYPNWKDAEWNADGKRSFAAAVQASRKFETWGVEPAELEGTLRAASIGSYADAASCVFRTYAIKKGRANGILGDKNNYFIQHIPKLREIFPNARFVHIVRDVRDVACSYRELDRKSISSIYQPRLQSNCAAIAQEWQTNNESARRDLMGAEHTLVRYEDLVCRTEETINGIFGFLGLERLHGITTELHLRHLDEPPEFLQWKAKLTGPVDTGSVGRYKLDLTQDEINVIQHIAGGMMVEYGYT